MVAFDAIPAPIMKFQRKKGSVAWHIPCFRCFFFSSFEYVCVCVKHNYYWLLFLELYMANGVALRKPSYTTQWNFNVLFLSVNIYVTHDSTQLCTIKILSYALPFHIYNIYFVCGMNVYILWFNIENIRPTMFFTSFIFSLFYARFPCDDSIKANHKTQYSHMHI